MARLAEVFGVRCVRLAGGAFLAPPTVAHVLALEAFKSPFVVGGKVCANDIAQAVWILSTPCKHLWELEKLAGGKQHWRICKSYLKNFKAVEEDGAKISKLLRDSLCFYRSAKDSSAKKTEASLGLALVVRLMAFFGYSRESALAERADWAVALIETLFALDGRMRIVTEAQAELMDKLAAAEKEAENGGKS